MGEAEEWADRIVAAHSQRRLLPAPTEGRRIPESLAYVIQAQVTQARLARGERIVGWKLGYTSDVMRRQMGIDSPNFGPLTDAMLLQSGEALPDSVTQPRVEPEVALVVGAEAGSVLSAHAALEVVDSVWTDYEFTWADNTADGSSAAYVVLGAELPLDALDSVAVTLGLDDEVVARGTPAAAMGSPLVALDWLRSRLVGHPRGLVEGDVVITGGLTAAIAIPPGSRVTADFSGTVVSLTRATERGLDDFGSLGE